MTLLYCVESFFATVLGLAAKRKQQIFLDGNYGPVHDELFMETLQVIGEIPAALDGVFARNGPNPQFQPIGNYHWFDGDGMVHACRIQKGRVSYCNRFVRTRRWQDEKKAGYPLYLKIGDMIGVPGLLMLYWSSFKQKMGWNSSREDGAGTANTAMVYHAGRLLALHEGDLPYQIRILCDGIVETAGRFTMDGKWQPPFTAHPKLDPVTGEMVFFGYHVDKKPHCVVGTADKDGKVVKRVEVDIPKGIMMHDIAMTEDYIIVLDVPLVFDGERMVRQNGLPFHFDKSRAARFGVLRRDATSDVGIKWFETEPVMIFHVANAWQEGNRVVMFAATYDEFDLSFTDEEVGRTEQHKPRLCKFVFDLSTGQATKTLHCPLPGEFPQVPATKVGRPSKYTYLATVEYQEGMKGSRFNGIAKIDLTATDANASVAGQVLYGQGKSAGEAYFVPNIPCTGEDDGFLITYVYDKAMDKSAMEIFDAKTMSSTPLASVQLPQRVPYGFHCLHVPEEQLKHQKKNGIL